MEQNLVIEICDYNKIIFFFIKTFLINKIVSLLEYFIFEIFKIEFKLIVINSHYFFKYIFDYIIIRLWLS
jgi:hypothetical protein